MMIQSLLVAVLEVIVQKNKQIFYIIIFIGICINFGCVRNGGVNIDLSEDQSILDAVNSKYKDDKKWFDDAILQKKEFELKYAGGSRPELSVYLENDIYLFNDPKLLFYIHGIIDKLLTGWHGVKPEFEVVVETGEDFNAYADELNLVHLSTGLLRGVENEDQLAAVLAHEISHILLRHHSGSSLVERTESALEMGGVLMLAAGAMADSVAERDEYAQKGADGLLACQSLGLVWADILAPQWSREDEEQADKMGLDLLMRAGYNYEELTAVIEKIYDDSPYRSDRLKLLENVAFLLIDKKTAALDVPGNETLCEFVKKFSAESQKELVESVVKRIESRNISHENREERINSIKEYLQKVYSGGDLPPESRVKEFEANVGNRKMKEFLEKDLEAIKVIQTVNADEIRGVLENVSLRRNLGHTHSPSIISARSKIAIFEHKLSAAKNYLAKLSSNEQAPSAAYIKLAELYLIDGDYRAAERVVRSGGHVIGRNFKFLPTLIRVQKNAGKMDAAEATVFECKKFDDERKFSLARALFNTMGESYYDRCVAVLGYDPQKKSEQSSGLGPDILGTFKKSITPLF